jgi:hypothetical protein
MIWPFHFGFMLSHSTEVTRPVSEFLASYIWAVIFDACYKWEMDLFQGTCTLEGENITQFKVDHACLVRICTAGKEMCLLRRKNVTVNTSAN